jgi:hypothetical protein
MAADLPRLWAAAAVLAGLHLASAANAQAPGDGGQASIEVQADETHLQEPDRARASPALLDGQPLIGLQQRACPERPLQVIVVLDGESGAPGAASTEVQSSPGRAGTRAAARVDQLDRALLRERALDALEDPDGQGRFRVLLGTQPADPAGGTSAQAHVERAERARLLGRLRDLDDDDFIFLIDP